MLAVGSGRIPSLPDGGESVPGQEERGLKAEGERSCFRAAHRAGGSSGGCNSGGSGGK